jgi:hypothetical protein
MRNWKGQTASTAGCTRYIGMKATVKANASRCKVHDYLLWEVTTVDSECVKEGNLGTCDAVKPT